MKKLALIFIFFTLFHNISIAESYKLSAYAYVNGLVCDFCARSLEKTIGKQDKVESIKIDLKDKLITINFYENQKLEENIITQLINDSGYTVREIKNMKKNNQSIWLLTFFPLNFFIHFFCYITMLRFTGSFSNTWNGCFFSWINWNFSFNNLFIKL